MHVTSANRTWAAPSHSSRNRSQPYLCAVLSQELHERVLQVLHGAAAASPTVAGARSSHWPTTRESLEGLKLDSTAVQMCKQFLLQVRCSGTICQLELLQI